MRVRSTIVLVVALLLAMMGVPVQAAHQETAEPGAAGVSLAEDTVRMAHEMVTRRTEPVRERPTVHPANVGTARVADYHDTCGDSGVGDLSGLYNVDTVSDVGWRWFTCPSRAFRGTADELVLMGVYDLSLPRVDGPDFAILQWPQDGYFEVYYAAGSNDTNLWQLLGSDFGATYGTASAVVAGEFAFPAATIRFPDRYEFAVTTVGADGSTDTLPKSGHPMPTVPTSCPVIVPLRAEVVLDGDAPTEALLERIEAAGMSVADTVSVDHGIVFVDNVDAHDMAWLSALEGVVSVQRPRNVEPAQLADNWHLGQLGMLELDSSVHARPAHVAVIDDGVDATHPVLSRSMGAGFDAVSGRVVPAGRSNNFGVHGTAVASMIVGDGASRVHGSNPLAIIRSVNVTTHDGCITTDRVANAIIAAANMPEVRVINVSLAGGGTSFAEHSAIGVAQANGKIVVAASGNDQQSAPNRPNFPASASSVIGVGATGPNGMLASFSQVAGADILAPGADVRVAALSGRTEVDSGTSFASPLVAGTLSAWMVDNPSATVDQARAALIAAGTPVPGSPAPLLNVASLMRASEPDPAPRFSDVAGTTHEAAIGALVDAGITSGFADGTFRPDGNVTRGQMASFLTRALDL